MKYLDALRFSLEITDIRKYVSTDYIPRRGVIPQKNKPKYKQKKEIEDEQRNKIQSVGQQIPKNVLSGRT